MVKPKRCARSFGKYCDVDNDERMSRQEWANCLSKDSVNREFIIHIFVFTRGKNTRKGERQLGPECSRVDSFEAKHNIQFQNFL